MTTALARSFVNFFYEVVDFLSILSILDFGSVDPSILDLPIWRFSNIQAVNPWIFRKYFDFDKTV